MKIYLTSDTHFEHEAMHEMCGRPKGYEQKILRILASSISKDDLLIHLGDFCWHKDAYWHEQFMALVSCRKWITLGNHDGHPASWYVSHGWSWAGESCTVDMYGARILFSRVPQPDTGAYDWNIHGHFHNTDLHTQMEHEPEIVARLTKKHILIALEHTSYHPVNLKTLLESKKREGDNL